MNFEKWLLQIGKSERSAKSYAGAVSGVMSEWAREEGNNRGQTTINFLAVNA